MVARRCLFCEFVDALDLLVEQLQPGCGIVISNHNISPEYCQFAFFQACHGALDQFDAAGFILALFGFDDELLVDSDELLLLLQDGLGFDGELSGGNLFYSVAEERPHETSPLGLEIHFFFVRNTVSLYRYGPVLISGTEVESSER